ncbi:long-chain fatty acid--CoA ligase [candidate division KSB1 bacterium]|nr:long-chain fatty acid--CoA ligase [candidate division KSB1 bacterium]NIR72331.1 long-chain fatty acid--CoA ligase [candidate division KSB1 bacterium]NIS26723.1 long-chain fatty acid--CoA ligase [candidate division KSB1 bacterium]NIT73469.1 long-chain fatty acid--CoA ligase [candidate division KSB1 bacterium]NIU27338.1 long-chain fatty acid--CoA ligase [candidate division KSB1 bacterium]
MISAQSNEEIIENRKVVELIQNELDTRQQHFAHYEKIREFRSLPEEFTVENGLLTPTLKVKRKKVEEKYADLIKEMYDG